VNDTDTSANIDIEELAAAIFVRAVAIAIAEGRGDNVYESGAKSAFQAAVAFYAVAHPIKRA